jgi:hypothetical protein
MAVALGAAALELHVSRSPVVAAAGAALCGAAGAGASAAAAGRVAAVVNRSAAGAALAGDDCVVRIVSGAFGGKLADAAAEGAAWGAPL